MSRRLPLPNKTAWLLLVLGAALAAKAPAGESPPGTTAPLKPASQAGTTVMTAVKDSPELFLGQAKVYSKVDKLVITVGEIINYEIEVQAPKGYDVAIPPPGAQLGEFLIRDWKNPLPETKDDRVVKKFCFQITSYATGESSIPPVPVILVKNNKPVAEVLAEEIRVRVAPVSSAEEMEIKDIKPPLPAAFDYKPLLITGVVLALLIAIGIAVVLVVRRMRRPAVPLPEPLPEPEQLALQELAELESLGLLQKGEFKEYYTRLSEITRRYLGLRFVIYALEFTTTETMTALKDKWIEHAAWQMIGQFLTDCDLVKFAKFKPENKAQTEIMDRSRKIIQITRPSVKEEPARAAGAQ